MSVCLTSETLIKAAKAIAKYGYVSVAQFIQNESSDTDMKGSSEDFIKSFEKSKTYKVNSIVNDLLTNQISVINNEGTVYINKGKVVSNSTLLKHFSLPFLQLIEKENPTVFNKLLANLDGILYKEVLEKSLEGLTGTNFNLQKVANAIELAGNKRLDPKTGKILSGVEDSFRKTVTKFKSGVDMLLKPKLESTDLKEGDWTVERFLDLLLVYKGQFDVKTTVAGTVDINTTKEVVNSSDKRGEQLEIPQNPSLNKVEFFNGFWTRADVAKQTDKVFLFGDNTSDRTIGYVPSSTQAVIRGLPNAIGIDTKKNRKTNEGNIAKPSAKGKMSFSYGDNKRNDVIANTTLEAIEKGERTATTRYESDGHIEYWKNLRVGDVIEWEGQNNKKVLVEVTKPLHKLVGSGKTPEQWSSLEGWSVDYFNSKVKPKLNKAWQIEYKIATFNNSSYFTDADFNQFKQQVDEAIQQAKDSGKTIVIPADGIGTGKAMLEQKAPKLFKYLKDQLNLLSTDGLNIKEDSIKTGSNELNPTEISTEANEADSLDNDEDTPFSVDLSKKGKTASVTKDTRGTSVKKLQERYPDAVIVKYETELPLDIQEAIKNMGAEGEVKGLYHKASGKVYLIQSNLTTMGEAEETYRHETLGHAGVINYLGDKLDTFASDLVTKSSGQQRAAIEKISQLYYGKEIKSLSKAEISQVGQEYIAKLAETPTTNPTMYNKIVAFIKEVLKSLGITLKITNSDINVLLNKVENRKINNQANSVIESSSLNLSKVDYNLKAVDILSSDKAKQVFEKGKKNGWDLNKILTELQIPSAQKQLLLDLDITDREKIISNTEPTKGVPELFESNPELANIGTSEQYSQYLDTIFPGSKVKDIVYHGTRGFDNSGREKPKFDNFDKSFIGKGQGLRSDDMAKGFYFGSYKIADRVGTRIIPAILNIKENNNTTIRRNTIDFDTRGDVFVVFEPEQIHILGSKQDIEGFKEYILQSQQSDLREQIVLELASNYSYSVEINTAKKQLDKDNTTDGFVLNNKYYRRGYSSNGLQIFEVSDITDSQNFQMWEPDTFTEPQEITKEEYLKAREQTTENTQHYFNLTVPGGTNGSYIEANIETPMIVPSIQSHAQFKTDNTIGWMRADEKQNYQEKDIDNLIEIMKKSGILEVNCG